MRHLYDECLPDKRIEWELLDRLSTRREMKRGINVRPVVKVCREYG